MSDVWTIHFDREGRPVGVSGPSLPVPEGGRERGMATMSVVPLAPLMRECSGPVDAAFRVICERLRFVPDSGPERARDLRSMARLAAASALGWRRDFSHEPNAHEAEDAWGVS